MSKINAIKISTFRWCNNFFSLVSFLCVIYIICDKIWLGLRIMGHGFFFFSALTLIEINFVRWKYYDCWPIALLLAGVCVFQWWIFSGGFSLLVGSMRVRGHKWAECTNSSACVRFVCTLSIWYANAGWDYKLSHMAGGIATGEVTKYNIKWMFSAQMREYGWNRIPIESVERENC